jgi:hypothetical protein
VVQASWRMAEGVAGTRMACSPGRHQKQENEGSNLTDSIERRRLSKHVMHERAYRHVDGMRVSTAEKKQIEGRHGDQSNRRYTEHAAMLRPHR